MINRDKELIGEIKEEISNDTELFAKAHLLCQRGLSIKEFNELDRQDKNFYIASLIYCKEEETKNQIALAKASNPFFKEKTTKSKKGHISVKDEIIAELSELEAKIIPIMNDNNEIVKEYKGIVNFKLTEDYNETKLPKTFDIGGLAEDGSIQIKNCEIKKYDFTTQKYEAEYNIKDVDVKDQKEEMLSKFVNSAFEGLKNQEDRKYSIAFGRKSNNSPVYFNIKENGEEVNIKVELC